MESHKEAISGFDSTDSVLELVAELFKVIDTIRMECAKQPPRGIIPDGDGAITVDRNQRYRHVFKQRFKVPELTFLLDPVFTKPAQYICESITQLAKPGSKHLEFKSLAIIPVAGSVQESLVLFVAKAGDRLRSRELWRQRI